VQTLPILRVINLTKRFERVTAADHLSLEVEEEEIWIKMPSSEVVEYYFRSWDVEVEPLTSNGWEELLRGSGLEGIAVGTYKFSASLSEYIDEIRLYSLKDYLGMLYRALALYSNTTPTNSIISPPFNEFTSFTS